MTSEGQASGKLILFGEHAVVRGVPALGLGVGFVKVRAEAAEAPGLRLVAPSWAVEESDGGEGRLAEALRILRTHLPHAALTLRVESDLPLAAGLGSSAALAVALARALAPRTPSPLDEAGVLALADELEAIFHGNPSGLDARLAFHGRPLLFARCGVPEHEAWRDYPRAEARTVLLPFAAPPLLVGFCGERHDTRALVTAMAERARTQPELIRACDEEITAIVKAAVPVWAARDWPLLGRFFARNQYVLDVLGVGHPALTRMINAALIAGAYGAKLTGAGGGGSVVAVAEGEARERVRAAWRELGFTLVAEVGA